MFTGIVSDIGTIADVSSLPGGDKRFRIRSAYAPDTITAGCSICCAGACLTVVSFGQEGAGSWFDMDASNETLGVTTLQAWEQGTRINLERALGLGAELGGHLMTGHVDGVADIVERRSDGQSERFVFSAPDTLTPYIAAKGSVALDGTSLTVNEVNGTTFGINVIPHTLQVTTWGERAAGDRVNLEIDLLARYVARLMEFKA